MSIFCFKKIDASEQQLCDLKKIREDKNLSLFDLENITHVPKKYLLAIEEYAIDKLPPANAYRFAYIRAYAQALDINYSCLIKNLNFEHRQEEQPKHFHFKFPNFSFYFILRNLGFTFLIMLFGSYIVWQVQGIIEPPKLEIFSPNEGSVSYAPNITLQGKTAVESRLTINGQDIMINEQGDFTSTIDLSKGVNTITISATKKHGKNTSLVRHVIYQEKTAQVSVINNKF